MIYKRRANPFGTPENRKADRGWKIAEIKRKARKRAKQKRKVGTQNNGISYQRA